MMHSITVSSQGVLSCGGVFVDTIAVQPPSKICYYPNCGNNKGPQTMNPDLVSFSAFASSRSVRAKRSTEEAEEDTSRKAKEFDSGSHAAMYYKKSGSFFSILVLRCDTWAVQWGVEKMGDDAEVTEMHALSAHTVVGLCSSMRGNKKLFVASRLDTLLAKRQDNRLWRQFMAKPRFVDLKMLDGEIVSTAPTGPSSFVVLTTAGSLILVTLSSEMLAIGNNDAFFTEQVLVLKGFREVALSTKVAVVSSVPRTEEGKCLFVVYTRGQTSLELMLLSGEPNAKRSTKVLAQLIPLAPKHTIKQVSFCGLSHICVFLESGASGSALQFVTLNTDTGEASTSSLVSLAYSPVASVYSPRKSTQTLICVPSGNTSAGENKQCDAEADVSSLIQTNFSLAHGPFTQSAVAKAIWRPLHDPYKHYGPRNLVEKSEASELFKDLQMLGDHNAVAAATGTLRGGEAGVWVPLELFYCLANRENGRSTDRCDVAVFSVKTAPFLHTRLIKQWHNATNGLKQVLQAGEVLPIQSPLAFAWHPRHLRRALRLMNQEELGSTFRNAVAATRCSPYAVTATSAVDTALQIVSLSRQLGAVLTPQDVETIAVLLRASRTMGHESLRYGSRMGLVLESTLQQRRMNRLLKQRRGSSNPNEEDVETQSATNALEKDFYGLPGEFRTVRALHTRYTANTWAQPLRDTIAYHNSIAALADEYMQETANSLLACGVVPDHASTWAETGRRSHSDNTLDHFESTLMAASKQI